MNDLGYKSQRQVILKNALFYYILLMHQTRDLNNI